MGKKSKNKRRSHAMGASSLSRREKIEARRENLLGDDIGDPRAKADHLRHSFARLSKNESSKWDPRRILVIKEYSDTMRDLGEEFMNNQFIKEDDFKFTKKISKSKNELACVRAIATYALGWLFFFNVEYDNGAQYVRRTVKICDEASEFEKNQNFGSEYSIGDLLLETKKISTTFLSTMRAMSYMSLDPNRYEGGVTFIGGDQCDFCEKTIADLGVTVLDCCSRCRMSYYCSQECQNQHWCDHKKVCRKPGEFKEGDMASFADFSQAAIIPFARHVKLISSVPESDPEPTSWLVQYLGENTTTISETKNLRRLRPAFWNLAGQREMDALLARLKERNVPLAGTISLDSDPDSDDELGPLKRAARLLIKCNQMGDSKTK